MKYPSFLVGRARCAVPDDTAFHENTSKPVRRLGGAGDPAACLAGAWHDFVSLAHQVFNRAAELPLAASRNEHAPGSQRTAGNTIVKCLPLMAVATLGFTGLAFADLVFAGSEPAVSVSALRVVEDAVNKQFQPEANDPWDYLGDSRGSYLPGYGAAFTFEMSLVNVTPINPFHAEISPQEKQAIHARKIKKLPVLKNAMRDLLVHAATTLTSVPPAEQITFEAFLDYFSFEDRAGLPRRLTMTASRQKILDAIAHHASPADFDTLIEVREEQ